ncbi:MAG: CdvA-like protein [Desulfurococcales archaeon]|nr:CdvA-like protein [Desulfurococcales archaeon]
MELKVEYISNIVGEEIQDEYGRSMGFLVSITGDIDGFVKQVEIKVADRSVERIPVERLRVKDGKLMIVPEWKYEAIKVIESLDRAYRRRKAVESVLSQGDIPGEVIETMKRRLTEEIKRLRVRAEEVKSIIRARINEIDDETLRLSSAIANLQVLYFSGEVGEKGYTHGMNQLRKLKNILEEEKSDAKKVLDRLEKILEIARAPEKYMKTARHAKEEKHAKREVEAKPPARVPSDDSIVVKIEE